MRRIVDLLLALVSIVGTVCLWGLFLGAVAMAAYGMVRSGWAS